MMGKGLCKVYSPTLFLIALEDSTSDFTGRRQQDTQEFLSYLLNTIEEETRLPLSEGKEVSPISDEFKGLGTNSIKCLKCGSESKSEEQFLALSLEIPQSNVLMRLTEKSRKMLSEADLERNQERSESMWNRFRGFFSQSGKTVITLYDCLLSHTLPERLQDTEQYFCERCNGLVDSEKVFKISASPNTLILHFKRFKYSFFGSKVDTYIQYPMELHFSEFTTGSESVVYDLSAVVVHSGRGVSRGHYTTYRKVNSLPEWYLFDDAKVTRVTNDYVLDQEAYLLFYTRKFEPRFVAYRPPESTEMCYVLKYWLLKLRTLASPGPLTQQHILCLHGKLSVRYSLQKDFSEVSVSFYAEMVRSVRN